MVQPSHVLPIAFLVAGVSQPPAGALVLTGAVAASLRRNHPIGGWLFFFFWEILVGLIVSVTSINWGALAPRAWRDQAKFFTYVYTIAPEITVMLAIAGAGFMLLRTYDWKWVIVLRYLLILFTAFKAISVVLDSYFFPSRFQAALTSLAFPIAYAIYFFVSTRLRSVFIERMWNHRAVSVAEQGD